MPPYNPDNPTNSAAMAHLGSTRQTHTGVNDSYGGKTPGLFKEKIMISYGVYKTRTAALNVQYGGFDDTRIEECECAFKAKITIPEKWLDSPTPVSKLKAFFMKSYRSKFPDAALSRLTDEEVQLAIKDESMFLFSKKAVSDDSIIQSTFYDRQDVWAMGPEDWKAMDSTLKEYRQVIVRSLAHCHRSATDSWEGVIPVTSAKQLSPTGCYVIFTGWYKMQCVLVQPRFTIADLKVYLHEKNGTRMPLESIDIGLRFGDDIKIIDDALTLQQVYEKTKDPNADYCSGPGTFGEYEERVKKDKEAAKRRAAEEARAMEQIEQNKDKRGPDSKYFRRHDTTSRVHADWDEEDSKLKTFGVDDQPHSKAYVEMNADLSGVIGPQMPMHLRKTHKPADGKYAHLAADGSYAEKPRIKAEDDEDADRIVDITDVPEPAQASVSTAPGAQETLAGLEPEPETEPVPETKVTLPSFTGKTLVLGVGKRIQDVKHKIWVATVHDPYSFRGPEDKAAGGGASDSLGLQQNGAPKGWSAPAEGEATVNQDEQCSIM